MENSNFIDISVQLDQSGLVWVPVVGDEISFRDYHRQISILISTMGLPIENLRQSFVWLPNVEQLVKEIEIRNGFITHMSLNQSLEYEVVVNGSYGTIEVIAPSLREAFGHSLSSIIREEYTSVWH